MALIWPDSSESPEYLVDLDRTGIGQAVGTIFGYCLLLIQFILCVLYYRSHCRKVGCQFAEV